MDRQDKKQMEMSRQEERNETKAGADGDTPMT